MFVLSHEADYRSGGGQREQQKAAREELPKDQHTAVFSLHQKHTFESSSICKRKKKKEPPYPNGDRCVQNLTSQWEKIKNQTLLSKHHDLGMVGWELYSGLSAEVLNDWVEPASQSAERALTGRQSFKYYHFWLLGLQRRSVQKSL